MDQSFFSTKKIHFQNLYLLHPRSWKQRVKTPEKLPGNFSEAGASSLTTMFQGFQLLNSGGVKKIQPIDPLWKVPPFSLEKGL